MDVRIGDTLNHVDEWGKVTSQPIITELDRQQAIGTLTHGVCFSVTPGSYLKDRSSFGPTSHDGRMFEGNVLVGGNVAVARQTD